MFLVNPFNASNCAVALVEAVELDQVVTLQEILRTFVFELIVLVLDERRLCH